MPGGSYRPTEYWGRRYEKQGRRTVTSPGNDWEGQRDAFLDAIDLEGCGSVFDYGCGVGRLAAGLIAKLDDPRIYRGYDPIQRALDLCPEIDGADFSHETPTDSFDAIVACTVLQHLPPTQYVEALRLFKALLVPGGRIVLIEHDPADPKIRGKRIAPHMFLRTGEEHTRALGTDEALRTAVVGRVRAPFENHYSLTVNVDRLEVRAGMPGGESEEQRAT